MDQFWRIGDFAKKLSKHTNTVDGWFKQLEDSRIHYVGRAGNEKVYDEMDLTVAEFIKDHRELKPAWALEAIFAALPEQLELRPFPMDMETTGEAQVLDIEALKKALRSEFQAIAEQAAASVVQVLPSYEHQRELQLTQHLTQRRIERQLEREALEIWGKKPEAERMRKVSLFRKEENTANRDRFIREYVDDRYESLVREAYGFEKKT